MEVAQGADACFGITNGTGDLSRVWLPGILTRVAGFLPSNEVAVTLRLANRAAAEQFAEHTCVVLFQPVPPAAFATHWSGPWACRGLTLPQRRQLLCLTVASGVMANLEVALAAAGCVLDWLLLTEVTSAAATAGHLDVCRRLMEPGPAPQGFDWGQLTLRGAEAGHKHIVEWCLASSGAKWSACTPVAALRRGHVALHEWLLSIRTADADQHPDWGRMLEAAAFGCDLSTLARLWAEHSGALDEGGPKRCLSAAACSRTSDWQAKAEWLEAQGCGLSLPGLDSAGIGASSLPGDEAALRLAWLKGRKNAFSPFALGRAALVGNLPAVTFFLGQGVSKLGLDAAAPALHGHLPVLQALAAAGCPTDPEACAQAAARGGRLSVLQWLLETYGAERLGGWSERLAAEGCASGSVEVVGWLRGRGCAFASEECWSRAASSGCEAALELLSGYGCPQPTDGSPYTAAARNGDLRTLSVLRRLGLGWGSAETFACAVCKDLQYAGSPVPALEWLLAEGCPVDWNAAVEAAQHRKDPAKDEVLGWLRARRGSPEDDRGHARA